LQEKFDSEQRRILANKEGISSKIGKIPILAIPDSRFMDRSQTTVNNASMIDDLRKDGATDFLYSNPFGPIISKGLFITAQQNSTDFTKQPYNLIQSVMSELANFSDESFSKNLSANTSPFFEFTRIESTSTTGDYKIYVKSSDNRDEVLLNNISQGTFSIVSICLMIFRFLNELYSNSQNILNESAIVLIDEIDAHLHPSWEQKIIGILRRKFPNVQFIITAHSPLIVAGCLEKEVAVIRNNEKGFSLEQNIENFIGLSTPVLLQKVFEIEDKDEQYLIYSALSGEEDKFRTEVAELERIKKGDKISQAETQKLNNLYNTLRYIDRVKQVQTKKATDSALKTQNILLKKENEFLKNQISGK